MTQKTVLDKHVPKPTTNESKIPVISWHNCLHFLEANEREDNVERILTTAQPYRSITPVRPNIDQAHLSPNVNETNLVEYGDKKKNLSTLSPTKEPINQPSMIASSMNLPTVFPAVNDGALNGTAPTLEPIKDNELHTSMKPTTKEKGMPLQNYSTVFPGLAYPSNRPTNGGKNESSNSGKPIVQSQTNTATRLPPIQPESPEYSSAKYNPRTTIQPRLQTTISLPKMLTTNKPTVKHWTQNEETEAGQQKDEFAYQTTQSNSQINVVVPHQIFNPEKEAEEDRAAEEERQRLLAMTPTAPVTYMMDSDEDVTSPDNENKDNDWRGLQYGPLALPPAFKKLPSKTGK